MIIGQDSAYRLRSGDAIHWVQPFLVSIRVTRLRRVQWRGGARVVINSGIPEPNEILVFDQI
jgi:hypothetical protein